jgi:hypothetical protein
MSCPYDGEIRDRKLYAEHGVDSGAGSLDRGLTAFQRGKRRVWRWSGRLVRGRLLPGSLCGGGR